MTGLTNLLTLGYIDLAIAIVQQAADDYRTAYRRYLRTGVRSGTLTEIENFFESEYGNLVALGMSKDILSELKAELKRKEDNYCGIGKLITYNGKTQAIVDWGRELGINPNTITKRLRRGWSVERALSTIPNREVAHNEAV